MLGIAEFYKSSPKTMPKTKRAPTEVASAIVTKKRMVRENRGGILTEKTEEDWNWNSRVVIPKLKLTGVTMCTAGLRVSTRDVEIW